MVIGTHVLKTCNFLAFLSANFQVHVHDFFSAPHKFQVNLFVSSTRLRKLLQKEFNFCSLSDFNSVFVKENGNGLR